MSATRVPLSSFWRDISFSACTSCWHFGDTLLCEAGMWHIKCLSSNPFSPQVSYISSSNSYVYQGVVTGKGFGQFGLQRLGEWVVHLVTETCDRVISWEDFVFLWISIRKKMSLEMYVMSLSSYSIHCGGFHLSVKCKYSLGSCVCEASKRQTQMTSVYTNHTLTFINS